MSPVPPSVTPDPDPADDASPRLVWAEDGSPRSGRFGDVYFSKDDGLAETRAVFLDGCGLPGAWAGRDAFTVAELGFGSGLNIVALLDLWRRTRAQGARLNVFSIEAYPLTRQEAERALAAWPELVETATGVLAAWPDGAPGFHRLDLPQWGAAIDLAVGEARWALEQWSGPADAWFLDGFSPAVNPAMWSPDVLALVAARSAPGARLATFTVAGAVRRGLAEQGFRVEKKPGHGRKRERLEARLDAGEAATGGRKRPARVAVIGAGIAGASVARALIARNAPVVVIEAERPGAGASGFPASLVTPRLDAGDGAVAGLYAQALTRAGDLYRAQAGAVVAEGVLQLEQASRDAARFDKIAAQPLWRRQGALEGTMRRLDADACSRRLGERVSRGGLMMERALTVRSSAVLEPWLAGAERVAGQVARLEPQAGGWRLLDRDGAVLAEAEAVVVAAGWGSAALETDLPLSPVAGQADWVEGVDAPAAAWGGYVAPTGEGVLFGATHDRGVDAPEASDEASARNHAALGAALPALASAIGRQAGRQAGRRVAVRATTPDRLPLCGTWGQAPGLYVLTGLGSRGFCAAPLLGEHLAALILGGPSPLPAEAARRIDPRRRAAQPAAPTGV